MLLLHYEFTLPPSFDMQAIRRRIEDKRHLFDHHEGLRWKAWLLSDAARHGASANRYAPLYLFEHAAAARDFLLGPLYAGVTQTFGWVQPHSGPLLGATVPTLHGARSCTLAIADIRSHAGLVARSTAAPKTVDGLLARAAMLDIGRMQLREYRFWDRDPAELPPEAEHNAIVFEVGAVSAPPARP